MPIQEFDRLVYREVIQRLRKYCHDEVHMIPDALISSNPGLTDEMIEANPDLELYCFDLSHRIDTKLPITPEIMKMITSCDTCLDNFVTGKKVDPNVVFEMRKKICKGQFDGKDKTFPCHFNNPNVCRYCFTIRDRIMKNPIFTWDHFREHPEFIFEYRSALVSIRTPLEDLWKFPETYYVDAIANPHYTFPELLQICQRMVDSGTIRQAELNRAHYYISRNRSVRPEDIINNPQIKWSYHVLSTNENLTDDFVRANMDKGWNRIDILSNKKISSAFKRELIERHGNELGCNPYIYVVKSEDVTWETMRNNKDLKQFQSFMIYNTNAFEIDVCRKIWRKRFMKVFLFSMPLLDDLAQIIVTYI